MPWCDHADAVPPEVTLAVTAASCAPAVFSAGFIRIAGTLEIPPNEVSADRNEISLAATRRHSGAATPSHACDALGSRARRELQALAAFLPATQSRFSRSPLLRRIVDNRPRSAASAQSASLYEEDPAEKQGKHYAGSSPAAVTGEAFRADHSGQIAVEPGNVVP